jgi:hypothetical protein
MSGLVDVLFALVIVGGALAYALPQLVALSVQPAQNDAGNQVAAMQAAGNSYIKNHFNSLIGNIGVGAATAVTPAQLIADGDLPAGFNDFNVFGQNHILVIAQPTAGVLDGMVFTYGGDTIPDIVAIRVAQAGPPNSMVVLGSDPGNFEGAAGGETVAASEFSGTGYTIAGGHLAAHIEPAQYAAEAPFLNRYYTGNSDDNTMHADIVMNGFNIDSAKAVTATQQVNTPMVADPNTPSYQIFMSGTSNINNLVAGGTITSGEYLHVSDIRLKENVREIENPVALVQSLRGHQFNWRASGAPDIGFIAQEVQQVIPEAVKRTPDGTLAVKYDVLTAPLVEAIKSQDLTLRRQQAEIAELREMFARVKP